MSGVGADQEMRALLYNMLKSGDLSFRDFMEVALYHPVSGYYSGPRNPIGKAADYVTAPALSPVFAASFGKLIHEFLSRTGDGMSTVVDIGCGDGVLIHSLSVAVGETARSRLQFVGVDRTLGRLDPSVRQNSSLQFFQTLAEAPRSDAQLVIGNELFDAVPFARLVMRDEHIHELWVTERDGELEWTEHEAPAEYEHYFAERDLELGDGQFADLSLEWQAYYEEVCAFVERGLIVTLDYGFPEDQLFHPRFRRFGTAASYTQQRVTRDLLLDPGSRDITAHINFTDLIRAGERAGNRTLFFDRQAKFLLALGAAEHELFGPVEAVESLEGGLDLRQRREDARRLILPDGIGEEIRVLVQSRGVPEEGWSFQRKLF